MISVIIPTCHREASLLRIVFALAANQENVAHEVIVTNDGPPLSLPVGRMLAGLANVRVIDTNARNVSVARNAGAAAARGDILAFLDDDIVPTPDWLSLVARAFAQAGGTAGCALGAITGRVTSLVPGSRTLDTLRARIYEARESRIVEGARTDRLGVPAYGVNFLSGGNCAVARACFDAVDGFSPHYTKSQDRDLALKLLKAGKPVFYLPELEVLHDNGYTDWFGLMRGRFLSGYFAIGLQHDHSGLFTAAAENGIGLSRSANLVERFARVLWGSAFNLGLYAGQYGKFHANRHAK